MILEQQGVLWLWVPRWHGILVSQSDACAPHVCLWDGGRMFLQHNAPSDLFIIQAALDLLWGGEGGSYDILIAYIDDPTATFDMSYTCQMDMGACIIWWGSVTCLLLPWTSFAVLFCHLPVHLLVKHVRMCHMRFAGNRELQFHGSCFFSSKWRNPWQL